jgi:hypothetical protein
MADPCEHCEGEMDAFGGVHLKDCPALIRKQSPTPAPEIPDEGESEEPLDIGEVLDWHQHNQAAAEDQRTPAQQPKQGS